MKPMTQQQFNTLVNVERPKYNLISTPTLQWLLRETRIQISTVTNRALSHQARIVFEAVKREIEFRNSIIKDELLLAEQWELLSDKEFNDELRRRYEDADRD